jgi:hypothetical protein
MSASGPKLGADPFKALNGTGAGGGPHNIGKHAEQAVQVDVAGPDQSMTEKVQPQVGITSVRRRCVEIDVNEHDLSADLTSLIVDDCRNQSWRGGTIVSYT